VLALFRSFSSLISHCKTVSSHVSVHFLTAFPTEIRTLLCFQCGTMLDCKYFKMRCRKLTCRTSTVCMTWRITVLIFENFCLIGCHVEFGLHISFMPSKCLGFLYSESALSLSCGTAAPSVEIHLPRTAKETFMK
jgi:hypothetical protein